MPALTSPSQPEPRTLEYDMSEMTLEEAIGIIDDRNGRPHEDDWDLADAATVVRKMVVSKPKIVRVSAKRLKAMDIGDCCVFSEPDSAKNAGAASQSFASRAGIKITTAACLIVMPSTAEIVKAVVVTRVA